MKRTFLASVAALALAAGSTVALSQGGGRVVAAPVVVPAVRHPAAPAAARCSNPRAVAAVHLVAAPRSKARALAAAR